MGSAILKDVLGAWMAYDLDASIYVPASVEPSLDTSVDVVPFDPSGKRVFEGRQYLLGIEQVRDAIEGLEAQLGRSPTPLERLRAVLHYAKNDAFIDPQDAIEGRGSSDSR